MSLATFLEDKKVKGVSLCSLCLVSIFILMMLFVFCLFLYSSSFLTHQNFAFTLEYRGNKFKKIAIMVWSIGFGREIVKICQTLVKKKCIEKDFFFFLRELSTQILRQYAKFNP
jgi:hypothetical protein